MKFFMSFAIIGLAILFTIMAAATHKSQTPSLDSYTNAVVKEYQDSTRHAQEVETYLKANDLK